MSPNAQSSNVTHEAWACSVVTLSGESLALARFSLAEFGAGRSGKARRSPSIAQARFASAGALSAASGPPKNWSATARFGEGFRSSAERRVANDKGSLVG